MSELKFVPVGISGLRGLYARVKRDFKANERPPRFAVGRCLRRGIFEAGYLCEAGSVRGYAVCTPLASRGFVLIYFFAVEPQARGSGYGGRFLELLARRYQGLDLIVEVEDPAFARGDEAREVMTRRVAFYERAGFKQLAAKYKLFGVDMLIMHAGSRPIPGLQGLMDGFYRDSLIFSQLMIKNVRVTEY